MKSFLAQSMLYLIKSYIQQKTEESYQIHIVISINEWISVCVTIVARQTPRHYSSTRQVFLQESPE